MSKQLAISSAFSILAMAVFALSSPGNAAAPDGAYGNSAMGQVSALSAPTSLRLLPSLR